jgi:hypothetical protein
VQLSANGRVVEGWTLNASRGGVRLVVEERLEEGVVYELRVVDAMPPIVRPSKVVWVQDEADGQICGLEFLDGDELATPAESSKEP